MKGFLLLPLEKQLAIGPLVGELRDAYAKVLAHEIWSDRLYLPLASMADPDVAERAYIMDDAERSKLLARCTELKAQIDRLVPGFL